MLAVFIVMAVSGAYQNKGDFLTFFRQPIHELYVDDVIALSAAVHQGLMAAADKVGIDTTKLTPREPFYAPKNRPRLRL